ncbi:uncharacterized protein LOC134718738 isoform X2 [Mytilus trossulus]|uniref:uncharacterized protein LOC134718738 isoform X2 n=1 Tax=Mytilus trossulus TaxID=6551 RepID=UPI003005E283
MTWKDEYCLLAFVIILFVSNAKSQRSHQISIRPGAIHIPSINSRQRNIISPNDLRNSNGGRTRFTGTDLQSALIRNRPFNGNNGLSRTISTVSDPAFSNARRTETQQPRTTLDDVLNSRITEQASQQRRSRDRVRQRTSSNSGTTISRIRRKLLVDLRTTFRYILRTGQLPRGVAFNMESGRPQLVQISPGSMAVNPFSSTQVRRYLRSIDRSLNGQENSPTDRATGQSNQADSTSRIGGSSINTRQNNVESLRDITSDLASTSGTNRRSVDHLTTSSRQGLHSSRTASQNINFLTSRSRPNSQNTEIVSEPRTTHIQSQSILPGIPVQMPGDGQSWSTTLFRAKLFNEPDNTIQTTGIEIPNQFTRKRTDRRQSERQVQQQNTRTRTEQRQPERHVQQNTRTRTEHIQPQRSVQQNTRTIIEHRQPERHVHQNTRTITEHRQPEQHVQQNTRTITEQGQPEQHVHQNTRTITQHRQPERFVQQNTRTRTEQRQPERSVQQNTRTRPEHRQPERFVQQNTRTITEHRKPERNEQQLNTRSRAHVSTVFEQPTADPDLKVLLQKIEREKALLTDLKRQEEKVRNNINSLNNQQTSSSKLLEDIALLQNMLTQAESKSPAISAHSKPTFNQQSSANLQPPQINPHVSLEQQLIQQTGISQPSNINQNPNILPAVLNQNMARNSIQEQHVVNAPVQQTGSNLASLNSLTGQPIYMNAVPLQHTLPINQAPMGQSVMPINQPGLAPTGHSNMPVNHPGHAPVGHNIMPVNQPGQAPHDHSIMPVNQPGQTHIGSSIMPINQPEQAPIGHSIMPINQPGQVSIGHSIMPVNQPGQALIGHSITPVNQPGQAHMDHSTMPVNQPGQTHIGSSIMPINQPGQAHMDHSIMPVNQPGQASIGHNIMPVNQPGQAPIGHSIMSVNQVGQAPMTHNIIPINHHGQTHMGHSIMPTNQFGTSPFGFRLPSEFLQEMMFGDTTDPPDPTDPPTTTPVPTTLPPTTAHVLTTPSSMPPVTNQYHQQVNNAATLNDILSTLQNSAVKGGFKLLFKLPGSNSSIPIEVLNSKSTSSTKDTNPTVQLSTTSNDNLLPIHLSSNVQTATMSPDELLHKHLSGNVQTVVMSPDELLHKHLSGQEQPSTIVQNGFLPDIPMQAVPVLSHEVKTLQNDNRKTLYTDQLLPVQPTTQLSQEVNSHQNLQRQPSSFNQQTIQSTYVNTTPKVNQLDANKTPIKSDSQVNKNNAIQMENFPSFYEFDLAKAKNANTVKIPAGNNLILDTKGDQISQIMNTLNQHGVISQSLKTNLDLSKVIIQQKLPPTTTPSYIINMIPYNTHASLPAVQPMTMNNNPNMNSNANFQNSEINPVRIGPKSNPYIEANPLNDRLHRIEHMMNKLLMTTTLPPPIPTFIEPDELEGEELPIQTTPMPMTTTQFFRNSRWQYNNQPHHGQHPYHNAHPNQQQMPNTEYRQQLSNQFSHNFGQNRNNQQFQNPRTNQNNAFSYQNHNQQNQDPNYRPNDFNADKPPVFSNPHIQHQHNQHHQNPSNQPHVSNNQHGHSHSNTQSLETSASSQSQSTSTINTTHECNPQLPNFGCEGVAMFTSMKSIGAWCVSKCVQGQCVESVCKCGCYINNQTNIKINEIGNEIASAFSGNSGNSSNANKALVDLYASLNKDASSHGYAVSPVEKQTNTPITTTTAPSDVKSLIMSIEKLIESKLSHIGQSNTNHDSSGNEQNPNIKEKSFDPRKPVVSRSDTTNNIHKSQASHTGDWRTSQMSNNPPNNQWNRHLMHQSQSLGWNQRPDVGFERRRADNWHAQSNRNSDHNNWNNPSNNNNPQSWQHHQRQDPTPQNSHWGNSGHRQNGPTSPGNWHDSRHSRNSGWQPPTTQGTWSFQGRRHWQSNPLPEQGGKRKEKKKGGGEEEEQ